MDVQAYLKQTSPSVAAAPPPADAATAKAVNAVKKQIATALNRLRSGGAVPGAVADYANFNKNFLQQAASIAANPLENVGRTTINVLNRPYQAELQGLHPFSGQGTNVINPDVIRQGVVGFAHGLTDLKGQHDITPFDAANVSLDDMLNVGAIVPNGVPVLGGHSTGQIAASVAAGLLPLAIDPTMGVGRVGAAADAAEGARAVGLNVVRDKLGSDVADAVHAQGLSKLDPKTQSAVYDALRNSQQAERLGPDTFIKNMAGEHGPLGFRPGALSEPAGVQFLKQTVVPSTAIKAAKDATGYTELKEAVGDSRAVRAVKDSGAGKRVSALKSTLAENFIPGQVMRNGINEEAARGTQRFERINRSAADRKLADTVSTVQHAAHEIPDIVDFDKNVVGPALEAGTHKQLYSELKSQGETAKANYVRSLDELRRSVTQEQLDSGALRQSQVHDINTYIPHLASPEAKQWLAQPENKFKVQAANLGYHAPSTELFSNIGPHFRNLEGNVAEKNEFMRNFTEGAVKEFFEPSPVKALVRKASEAYSETAKLSLIHDWEKFDAGTGTPFAIAAKDTAGPSKQFAKIANEHKKAIDNEIAKTKTAIVRDKVATAKAQTAFRHATASKLITDRRIAQIEQRLERTRAAVEVAKAAAKTARDAGQKSAGPQAAMLDRIFDLDQTLKELAGVPGVDEAEVTEAARLFNEAKQALVGERAAESKRAAGKGVQQNIGKTQAVARYEQKITSIIDRQLATLRSDSARFERQRYGATLAQPTDRNLQHLAALQEQRKSVIALQNETRRSLQESAVPQPEGYIKAKFGNLGEYYMHPAAYRYLKTLESKIDDPNAVKQFGEGAKAITDVQRNLALNFPILGAGRFTRNLLNDLTSMWTRGGFSHPEAYLPAARIANALRKVGHNGETLASVRATLRPDDRQLLDDMESEGQLEINAVQANIAHAGLALSKADRAKIAANPRYAESLLTRHTSELNNFGNFVSRVAYFKDQMLKHGDPAEAAHMADEVLFNYRDLAPGEQAIRRYLIPFYTWTARNLKLQLWLLTHAPGRTVAVERLISSIANNEANGNTVDPQYAITSGQIPLMNIGGTPILGGVQTPFEAAAQTVQPLADIASQVGPSKYTTQAGASGGLAALSENVGNAGGNAVKGAVQLWAGKNLVTGAPIKQDRASLLQSIVSSQVPRESSIAGIKKNTVGNDATAATRAAQALKLLGVSATAVTPKASESELYRRYDALNTAADRQGIPTVSQLKKQGKYKTASSTTK